MCPDESPSIKVSELEKNIIAKIASNIFSNITSSNLQPEMISSSIGKPLTKINVDDNDFFNNEIIKNSTSPDDVMFNIDFPENVNRPIPSDDEDFDDDDPAAPAGYDEIPLNDDFEPNDPAKWDPDNPVDEDGKVIKWNRDDDYITVECGGKIWVIEDICGPAVEVESEGNMWDGRCSVTQWENKAEKFVVVEVDGENIEKHFYVKINDCSIFIKCVTITPIKRQKYRCVHRNQRGKWWRRRGRPVSTKSIRTRTITIPCCSSA